MTSALTMTSGLTMNRAALMIALALAGCFDSIVDNPCAPGYELQRGACVTRLDDEGPDAGTREDAKTEPLADAGVPDAPKDGTTVDGTTLDATPPDAFVCAAPTIECEGVCIDVASNADHCGTCGRVCPSGICEAGHCVGELSGHIVVIGHDYQDHHAAMRRVLGNAIALGAQYDVGVARFRGSSTAVSSAGTSGAIGQAMVQLGRPWHPITISATPPGDSLPGVDVLVIEAQVGDADAASVAGTAWATSIDLFLQRGGVVVVLEGAAGVSYRFAAGANLVVSDPPVEVTGMHALIADATDAVAQQVLSPYLAETTSVVFPSTTGPIVTLQGTLVIHQTRY